MSLLRVIARRSGPVAAMGRRTLAAPARASTRQMSGGGGFNPLFADGTNTAQAIFHKTSIACLIITPIALVAHPTPLSMPLDIVLAVLFPFHGHIGLNWILTDYVKAAKPGGPARMALTAITGLTILGLLKVSVAGEGLVGTLKAIWKTPEEEKKK